MNRRGRSIPVYKMGQSHDARVAYLALQRQVAVLGLLYGRNFWSSFQLAVIQCNKGHSELHRFISHVGPDVGAFSTVS